MRGLLPFRDSACRLFSNQSWANVETVSPSQSRISRVLNFFPWHSSRRLGSRQLLKLSPSCLRLIILSDLVTRFFAFAEVLCHGHCFFLEARLRKQGVWAKPASCTRQIVTVPSRCTSFSIRYHRGFLFFGLDSRRIASVERVSKSLAPKRTLFFALIGLRLGQFWRIINFA